MKNFHFKSFLVGILITSLIGIGSLSYGESISKKIDVFYNNIKIVVDGTAINPMDGNGNKVEPFIYNGTTYLPVRAIGEAFGKSVSWNGKTQTVYVGGVVEEKYMSDILKPYYGNMNVNKEMTMGGKKYDKGYSFTHGENVSSFNLDGKYTNIKGLIGLDDLDNNANVTVQIYGDDQLIKTYEIREGSLPQKLDIDVTGVLKLDIKTKNDNCCYIDLVNVTIK